MRNVHSLLMSIIDNIQTFHGEISSSCVDHQLIAQQRDQLYFRSNADAAAVNGFYLDTIGISFPVHDALITIAATVGRDFKGVGFE